MRVTATAKNDAGRRVRVCVTVTAGPLKSPEREGMGLTSNLLYLRQCV